ncbi:hypothetical protein HBI73_211990 [Parastagonospora nodorum]|nr:hypothetical protein HBI09_218560 [Parastagonospora nodorum]KAH4154733.1 hypothetical protein HBH43_215670 [Parastagonospora nodorum]KAH4975093.1 hypothetical protein HBI77_228550 [Parastagonospora nodorum]KAH5058342.1 hypothetical protein HBI73_211990 [Parastagonospora nodorum]KAH5753589.1 hypothetical protein HBI16_235570 [Parastagonospora nodorum]
MSEMNTYQYEPLDANNKEIRVLHLQPGAFEDPIHVSIEHIHFDPPTRNDSWGVGDEELQTVRGTLPSNWKAHRTLEGRLIYLLWDDEGSNVINTSWKTPDSSPKDYTKSQHALGLPVNKIDSAFEAVSYTWGTIGCPSDIDIVQEQSLSTRVGKIAIGLNLWKLLHQICRTSMRRTLWIDAICINQNDLLERSEEVPRMRAIFTCAERVIIWLGETAQDSTTALHALNLIGRQLEYTLDDYFLPAPDHTEANWWNASLTIPLDMPTWNSIEALMQRSYFERLWTVQEAQVASPSSLVQCGATEVPWYYVRRAFIRCRYQFEISSQVNRRFTDHLSRNLRGYSPMILFALASDRKCSEPRDKVFAILGLLPPTLTRRIRPLYSLPVEDVYMQACVATIQSTRRLGILECANPQHSTGDYATWVPNLTQSIFRRYSVGRSSLASSFSASHVSFQSPCCLQVRGVLHGRITAVSHITTSHATHDYPTVCEIIDRQFPNMTDEARLSTYLWVVTQGYLSDRWHKHVATPTLREAQAMLRDACINVTPNVQKTYRDWFESNLTEQRSGRFFVTDHGHVGCGPPSIHVGDQICIALGSDHPILLRRTVTEDESTMMHRYVGPSYIHGLMEGQALLGPLPHSWDMIIDHSNHISSFSFLNHQTKVCTTQDPRLGPLPLEWEAVEKEYETRPPFYVQHHRNNVTGEFINSDPRLSPEVLKARGVDVTTIVLV